MGSCLSTGISVVATVKGNPVNYKIIIVGDSGVGKSSIFLRYTKNQFDYTYKPTMSVCIESVVRPCPPSSHQQSSVGNHATTQHRKKMPQAVVVSLWDLPGKDEVDLRKVYYKNLDGVIVVAELEAELNTESILQWKQDILDNIKDESGNASTTITVPFLLLGSKQDKLSMDVQKLAVKHLKKVAFENDFIDGIPVSASNGDGSIHKAVQLLVQLMVENTQGLHRDNATDAMKRTLAAKLTVYSLDLTEDHELDMTMAQCAKQLTVVEQRYETFQKGLLKFRQNCVVAGITSASLSSIEQCVLALRSSLMADNETLQYKMEDGFPELYINRDSNNCTSSLPVELSHIVSLYHSQVYTNGKELLISLPAALKLCNSSLEQLAARIQANNDDNTSSEDVTEAEQIETNSLHNNKILEQKQATLDQWLSKVQGTSEKVLASMLWEDTNEA